MCLHLKLCPTWPAPPQVLIPARSWHQQLLEEGEDVFAREAAAEAAVAQA